MQDRLDNIGFVGHLDLESPVEDITNAIPSIATRVNHILGVAGRGNITPMADLRFVRASEQFVPNKTAPMIRKEIYGLDEIVQRFNVELHYVTSGSTGHTFQARCRNSGKIMFAMKVAAYPRYLPDPKNPDVPVVSVIDDIRQAQNTELRMILLLSELVIHGKTPHIVLPLWTFNTPTERFAVMGNPKSRTVRDNSNILENKQYQQFVKGYYNQEFEEVSSVLISEWCDRGDLLDYIRKNFDQIREEEWVIIIFQVLIMLAKIHEHYPEFKHNDFKCNNILLHSTPPKYRNEYYCYPLGDKLELIVPDIGYQLKMWDFDFASIGQFVANSKVDSGWASRMGITSQQNQYYDVHYFFHFFLIDSVVRGMPERLPPAILEFVHRIIPKKYRPDIRIVTRTYRKTGKKATFVEQKNPNLNRSSRMLHNTCFVTPKQILERDPLFKKFRRTRVR